ncbi:MAG: hypothetical protein JXR73_08710 [Candidatus Omnitrophica bacterium]|nr:hypothetical protein [Candidatus Omnitrophota bacterium]
MKRRFANPARTPEGTPHRMAGIAQAEAASLPFGANINLLEGESNVRAEDM